VIPERFDVGFIPCTRGKNVGGVTAQTLYRGSLFSLAMQHAQQRCATIVIVSAKFGLLTPTSPVEWYDKYLPNLSPQERERLVVRVRQQLDPRWLTGRSLSYLPLSYFELLAEAAPELGAAMRRPYRKMGGVKLASRLVNEIKNYGTHPARR
jgi:hypothetical protein